VPGEARLIGSPRFWARACFHARTAKSQSDRSPGRIAQDHSLVLELLFRVPSLYSPALALSGVSLPARVSSLSATSPKTRPLARGFPSPRYVPSAGALNLSTAFSALRLLGLFHPSAASRVFARPGASHLRAASPPHRSALPPCRCAHRPLARTNPDCHDQGPRLRGLVPRGARAPRGW